MATSGFPSGDESRLLPNSPGGRERLEDPGSSRGHREGAMLENRHPLLCSAGLPLSGAPIHVANLAG